MQRSATPASPSRNRSLRVAYVRATLHMWHTPGLSRSPQTVPTCTQEGAEDARTWWRGFRWFAGRPDLNERERAGTGAMHTQPPGRCTTQISALRCRSPHKLATPPDLVDLRVRGPKVEWLWASSKRIRSRAPRGCQLRSGMQSRDSPQPARRHQRRLWPRNCRPERRNGRGSR
jgi:hypothetical protein